MAIIEVRVPAFNKSAGEAKLWQWKKKISESVIEDEVLIEIETDKIILECYAPSSGFLVELLQPNGATVVSGQLIAHIDTHHMADTNERNAAIPAPKTLPPSICLIGQAACGRVPGNPVCPKCGLDDRVVYPGQADREAAQEQAELRYLRAHVKELEARALQPGTPPAEKVAGLLRGRYQILGDGSEVKDIQTGLVWARCPVGQHWDGNACQGSPQLFTFDEARKLAVNGWRVPTVRELASLIYCSSGEVDGQVDLLDGGNPIARGCAGNFTTPTIHLDAFPGTSDADDPFPFWSSSPYAGGSGLAWVVYFYHGYVNYDFRFNNYAVRLVRASQ